MKHLRIREAVLMLAVCAAVTGCSHPKGELEIQIGVQAAPAVKEINPLTLVVVSAEADGNNVDGQHESMSKLIATSLADKLDRINGVRVVGLTGQGSRIAIKLQGGSQSKLARKLGAIMGIDAVAIGSVQSLFVEADKRGPKATELVYQLRLIDAASGGLLATAEAAVKAEGGYMPAELADETAQAIANELEVGIR